MFPATGSKQINMATQSVISSDVPATHDCDKPNVEVATKRGPHISEKRRVISYTLEVWT